MFEADEMLEAEEVLEVSENFEEQDDSNAESGQDSTNDGEFVDKTLVCKDCGSEFVFTAGEQEFFAEKGFQNEPRRCKACRDANRNNRRVGGEREFFTATCANCGGEAKVPFPPSGDRPVYCSTCYEKIKENRENSSPSYSRSF